jgi:hypothetical protein
VEIRQAVIHDLADVLVSNAMEFQFAPTACALQSAAAVLQKRYAILRCALRQEEGKIWFDSDLGGTPEVTEHNGEIELAMDAELHRPFTSNCGWRIGVCCKYVLFSYHHSFFDGTSVMLVLRDLCSILGQQDLHEVSAQQDTVLPPSARGCLLNLMPYELAVDGVSNTAAEALIVPRGAQPTSPVQPRSRTTWRQMVPLAAEALRARCRQESTTVTGAIGAAAVRSFSRVFDFAGRKAGIRTFFNIRDDCKVPPCMLGAYYSFAPLFALTDDGAFWDTARSYRSEINESMRRKQHLLPAFTPPDALDKQRSTFAKLLAEDDGSPGPCSIGLSNRGAWKLPEENACQVKAVYFAQAKAKLPKSAYLMVNVCSVNGTLCITVVYSSHNCNDEAAGAFADGIVHELVQASSTSLE